MKEKILQHVSDLMDGELAGSDAGRIVSALREDGEGRLAWRTYHLIGDVLRDHKTLSATFSERVAASLAREPTVLAPVVALPAAARSWRRYLTPAAAGIAAAGFVGAVAFMLPMQEPQVGPIAQGPQVRPTPAAQVSEPAQAPVPLPAATDDYLLAHQGYSPRNRLQGVAPYVRTVSGQALESKR
jgi:sigma-E factor negative regulatory protein RseA